MLSPGMLEVSVEFSLMLFSGQGFELGFSRTLQEEETERPPSKEAMKEVEDIWTNTEKVAWMLLVSLPYNTKSWECSMK